ncbi:MAG: hypothetical protein ACLFRX_07895 [Gemmatimonadota bacterium]
MNIHDTTRGRRGARRLGSLLALLIVAAGVGACDLDDLLDVEDPEVASPGSVQDPSALPVVFSGAVRDFTWAYSGTGAIGGGGDNDPLITVSGLLTDEFLHYGTFPTRQEVDLRSIPTPAPNDATDNATVSDPYHNLHRARRSAEVAEDLYEAAEAGSSAERSVVRSLAGYTYILFGEMFCEGVPYSSIDIQGNVTFGEPSTRTETFNRAQEWFGLATSAAEEVGDDDALYLAKVGLARALVNLGDYAAAAAEVADVPSDWEYVIEHSDNSTAQENGVWKFTLDAGRYGLIDNEGGTGLIWSDDERTPVLVGTRSPFDTSIDTYIGQGKYTTRGDNVVLADGREARLIEAEAALDADDVDGFRTAINAARAVDGLDPLDAGDIPDTEPGRVDLLFAERGHALWMTGHRLGDLRRMIRQYQRSQSDVFPSGSYFRDGLEYGTDVNLPIYVDENNNPEFVGCINRDA